MDFSNIDLDILIPEMDAHREAQKISYQKVADACQVSQATIIRIFKRQNDPTVAMLQKISAAIKYEARREEIILTGYTQDDYIHFLQRTIEAQKEEHAVRMAQQEAHYNMLLAEKNRWIRYLFVTVILVAGFLVGWLIVDVTHPDIGWIQRDVAYYGAEGINSLLLAVRNFFRI